MLANNSVKKEDRKTFTVTCNVVGTEQLVKVNVRKEFDRPSKQFLVQVDHDPEGEHTWLRNSAMGIITAHEQEWFSSQGFNGLEHKGKLYMQLEPLVEVMPTAAELAKAKSVVL